MTLFPAQGYVIKGTLFRLFQIMIGRMFMRAGASDQDLVYWIGAAWMLGFVFLGGRNLYAFFDKKPSFEADNDGFSVMGKAKRPWSDYKGAQFKTIRIYFFALLSWVIVKTGTGLLAPSQQIQWGNLSEKPKKMAEKMNNFATKQIAHGN